MGAKGPGKTTLGAYIDQTVADYIKARAEKIAQTPSWAGDMIVRFWLSKGAPPLAEFDVKPMSYDEFLKGRELQKVTLALKAKATSATPFHKR